MGEVSIGVTSGGPVRVLYSFPHKLGASRICYTAWEQVRGLSRAGAEVSAEVGVLHRPVPASVRVATTLSWRGLRVPYRMLGIRRACWLHDELVARRLERLAARVDIVHAWPMGALRTLRVAEKLGIPTVLERPNAHTRFAFAAVQQEADRIGVPLPPGSEHAFDARVLAREEAEFAAATCLLCPSDFVVRTFREKGFPVSMLARHIYGYDERRFIPAADGRVEHRGLSALFVGFAAVRKGLHLALEAWLDSPAHRSGRFLVAGEFLPAYRRKLAPMLAHPSVEVLGQRDDVPELMRQCDVVVLPSIEEGFGLVCVEAMGAGVVPLVSDACTDVCRHMENALVHSVGDVAALSAHFTMLQEDVSLLRRLRAGALATAPDVTWDAAGRRLLNVYQEIIASHRR